MYMHQWDGANAWFINMPMWVPTVLALLVPFLLLFILWSVVWKGLALWHAAQRGDTLWFIILLVVNTLGILEIIYLFFVAKLKFAELFTKHTPHHGHPREHTHTH